MKHRLILSTGLILLLIPGLVTAIMIEPDDFALGTDISNISPFVTLSTVAGAPVFASTINKPGTLAAGGNDTGPLGDAVFSRGPDRNSEWFFSPSLGHIDDGLVLDFNQPVESFSLLIAELFGDADCCVSDPTLVKIFGLDGALIKRQAADTEEFLGGYLGDADDPTEAFPYWKFEFSGDLIGKVIIGGDSEPTSIDRLDFQIANVPEPGTLLLTALGLIGIGFIRRKKPEHFH